ncbi:MAG: uroporphyrin-III C-methyltransferase [Myxococcales bacterium]|nr:uroporphyrin-III C-methyltransferase [Myxococcales bacterium]
MADASYAVFTREIDASSAYTTVLAQLGLAIVPMPLTRTEPPRDPHALARALDAGGHAAIFVASARAAAALIEARGQAALPEVWAVGPATLRALAAGGIPAVHPASAHDGASLAHALIAKRDLAGRRVLFPRAEDGREEAMSILRAATVGIDDVIAYRTVPSPADDPALARGRELLLAGQAAVCVVFAPSQVTALTALIGPLGGRATLFAAIGDTTAAVLREAGVANVVVASAPTPEGLANAIAAVYPPRR